MNIIRIFILSFGLCLAWLAVQSRSADKAEPRRITAHTTLKQGIPHAQPLERAERY